MQSVDGDIRISVGINVNPILKTLKNLGKKIQTSLGSVSEAKGFDKVDGKIEKLTTTADKLDAKIRTLRSELASLEQSRPTKAFSDLQEQIKTTSKYYDSITSRAQNLRTEISTTPQSEYKDILVNDLKAVEAEIASTKSELDALNAKQQELIQTGQANVAGDPAAIEETRQALQNAEAEYDQVRIKIGNLSQEEQKAASSIGFKEKFSRLASIAKSALSKAGAFVKNFASVSKTAFNKVVSVARSAFSKISNFARSSSKNSSGAISNINGVVRKGLKTLLRYGLGIRGTFMLFRKLRNAVKEGLGNLAQYSSDVNKDISGIMSAFTKLKNALATMFQPILKAVAPVLTSIINKASQVATYIAKLMAAFTGQQYVYEAVDVQEDYASSLDKTSKSANKAKKSLKEYLSPLDDINKFQEASTEDADDTTTTDPSKMFKTVAVESTFKDLASKIKDILKSLDWSQIGIDIGKKLNSLLNNIDWNKIKTQAKNFATRLYTLINGFIRSVDWGLVGTTISNAIITALDFLITLVKGLDWAAIGKAIVSFLTHFKFAGIGKSAQNLFNAFANAFKNIDFKAIGEAFRNGLSRINWKGIWNSLTKLVGNALQGILDFFGLKGVSTSNLKSAMRDLYEPIKNIWNTLKDTVGQLLKPIIENFLPSLVGLIGSILKGIDPIIKAVSPIIEKVIEVISNIITDLSPVIETLGETIGKIISALSPIIQPILDLISNIVSFLAPVIDGILTAVSGIAEFISPFTEFVGGLVSGVSDLVGKLAGKQQVTISETVKQELDNIADISEDLITVGDNIDTALGVVHESIDAKKGDVEYVDTLKDRMDQLLKKSTLSDSEMEELNTIADLISEKFPKFKETWDKMVTRDTNGKLTFTQNRDEMITAVDNTIDALERQYMVEATEEQQKELIKARTEATADYNKAIADLKGKQEGYKEALNRLSIASSNAAEAQTKFNKNQISSAKLDEANTALANAQAEVDGYKTKLNDAAKNALIAKGKLGQLNTEFKLMQGAVKIANEGFDEMYDSFESLRWGAEHGLVDMEEIEKHYKDDKSKLYTKGKSLAQASADGYKDGVEKEADKLRKAGIKFGDSAIDGAMEGFDAHSPSKEFVKIGGYAVEGFNEGIDDSTSIAVKTVKRFAQRLIDTMKTQINGFNVIEDLLPQIFKNTFNIILQQFETFLSRITTGLNGSFEQINSINRAFATSGGKNQTYTTWSKISAIKVPPLARGAVIPPNREFLAMLGDQTQGMNIETPEKLLRQLLRDELKKTSSKNVYEIPLVIGRKTITKLIIDEAKLMLSQTGKNPFDLGTM